MDYEEYKIEDLLPIIAKLSDQYTSKDSSSVSYKTARMLMEAVIYAMNEALHEGNDKTLRADGQSLAGPLYERGTTLLLKKAQTAREIFESIAYDFEDYGCQNYKEMIRNGIPAFFKKYDIKYNPQDHILTMDYPLLTGNPDFVGIDLIYQYLKGIQTEISFMNHFHKQSVIELMGRVMPGYEKRYMDNLCAPVLLNAVGCVIAERSVSELLLDSNDLAEVKEYFAGDDLAQTENKVGWVIRLLMKSMPDKAAYFEKIARDYAVRILNGMRYDSLEQIMILK